MNRMLQSLVVLVAAGAVLATALPEAESARKASMAESRLVEDKNDIYLFPQVGVEHTQLLSLDYGVDSNSGGGLAILGDEDLAFGIGLYRGDLLQSNHFFPHTPGEFSLGNIGNPIEGEGTQLHTIGDFFVSTDLGGGLLGARLALGSGGNTSVNPEDEASGTGHTFGALTLGYSLVDDIRLDSALTTRFSTASDFNEAEEDVNQQTTSEGSSFLIGASARAYVPMDENVELGVLGDVQFDTQSLTSFPDDGDIGGETSSSTFSLFSGAGPVYRIDNTTIAGYGVLGYLRSSQETQGVDQDDEDVITEFNTGTVLPGMHVAADIEIFEWLFFRTGVQYSYGLTTTGQDVDPANDDANRDNTFTRIRGSQFGWRAGLGVEVDNFTLDGVFQDGFMTGGPDFIGGAGSGMFTMISAGYQF